jgi:hypothetical protein
MRRRIAIVVAGGLLIGSCALSPDAVAGARYVRDWQVERPLSAGVLKGLSLGTFPGTRYGQAATEASPHDPYGMSYAVYEEVQRLGRVQYRAGLAFGGGFWLLLMGGGIYRRLTTLQIRRLESAHAQ